MCECRNGLDEVYCPPTTQLADVMSGITDCGKAYQEVLYKGSLTMSGFRKFTHFLERGGSFVEKATVGFCPYQACLMPTKVSCLECGAKAAEGTGPDWLLIGFCLIIALLVLSSFCGCLFGCFDVRAYITRKIQARFNNMRKPFLG